uniref:Uncharacterized protein n=1 Tax=Felis catus TaxID=9685 RepID=A0ABI7Y8X9_FELCA
MEAPMGQLTLLEEEEGCSGGEDAPEEEGAVELASALDEVDKGFQCPKEEDTVKLEGIPGCKTCPRFWPAVCQRCCQDNLASVLSFSFNDETQCSVSGLNQCQVWIGGKVVDRDCCKRFHWVDGQLLELYILGCGPVVADVCSCVPEEATGVDLIAAGASPSSVPTELDPARSPEHLPHSCLPSLPAAPASRSQQ